MALAQEKVVGREGQWVMMAPGPLFEGRGGGLEHAWLGRTMLCPQPASFLPAKARG